MSAFSPTLPRTTDLHGTDRLLVLVGSALADLGRRRAAARSRTVDAPSPATATPPGRTALDAHDAFDAFEAATERTRDHAAMSRTSLLP